MSDQGGGDRPRWEGFPGGVGPDEVPPVFPVRPVGSEDAPDPTAPIPIVPPAAAAPAPIAGGGGGGAGGGGGDGLGPRSAARARTGPRQDTSRLVALACAVAVVLVGSGFAFVACSDDAVDPEDNAPVVALTSVAPTPSAAATTRSPSPSRSASAPASATASASARPSSSPSAAITPVKQPVTVLNSTAIVGLAARVARDVEAGGWTVTDTTNWRGAQPAVTTIYYLPGEKNKASAKLFAQKFPVAKDVKKALPGMTSTLTLVLTRDAS